MNDDRIIAGTASLEDAALEASIRPRLLDDYLGQQPVREQIRLMDRLAAAAGSAEKRRMAELFMLSSRYEYLFWEQAYRLESWPV